ncbi:hypothetical protein BDV09DRAFT_168721 [Aspergillus tetrazonus]
MSWIRKYFPQPKHFLICKLLLLLTIYALSRFFPFSILLTEAAKVMCRSYFVCPLDGNPNVHVCDNCKSGPVWHSQYWCP